MEKIFELPLMLYTCVRISVAKRLRCLRSSNCVRFLSLSHKNYEEAQKTVYIGDWENCSVPSLEVQPNYFCSLVSLVKTSVNTCRPRIWL